jgi:hypothetical protein
MCVQYEAQMEVGYQALIFLDFGQKLAVHFCLLRLLIDQHDLDAQL